MPRLAPLTVALLLAPLTPALASTVNIQASPGTSLTLPEEPVETSCSTVGAADCVVVDDAAQSEEDGADQDGGEGEGGGD